MYNSSNGLPTPSYETSIPTSTSSSYTNSQYAPSPGIYPAPGVKAESYKSDTYSPTSQRPRFASSAGLTPDINRGQMTSSTAFSQNRRHSTFGSHASMDPSVSGVSSLPIDAKSADQSNVYPQQSYFDSTRDNNQGTQNYAVQRASLPTLSPADFRQVEYNRNGSASYMPVDHVSNKDTWPLGNQSGGHAHYGVNATQQWASAAGS